MRFIASLTFAFLLILAAQFSSAEDLAPLRKPTSKPRVIISTDAGVSDADDIQSLIHYLAYADCFDTEGIVSSPPGPGRVDAIHRVLAHYAKDWQWMRAHADFPHARDLSKLVKQGSVEPSSRQGFGAPTQGSEWIVHCARKDDDPRPLWVLVWGCITDVAQALHDAPDIRSRLRVHFIASWNLKQDPFAFEYIDKKHPELFMIHNDTTFRGWYCGGDQSADLGNRSFVTEHIADHGALGKLFASCHASGVPQGAIKMGDTPTVAYLLRGNRSDPTLPHWGGQFVRHPKRPRWFIDDPSPESAEDTHAGARTINRWRTDYLRDWQIRMDWCLPITRRDWTQYLEEDEAWYHSPEAEQIAHNVMSHQASAGGWAKNLGSFQFPFYGNVSEIDPGFDNHATLGEIRFLGKIGQITNNPTYIDRCLRGIDFVLATQYRRSGGWPQEISSSDAYVDQITFNDDAMLNILELLRDIAHRTAPFDTIVEPGRRRQACEEALQLGIQCILHTQIIVDGQLTVWCAQHDRITLLPCAARGYEHPSLSGQESVRILRFLMKLENPTPDVIAAIHSGCRWFRENQLSGIRRKRDPNGDIFLEQDPDAPPLWARFSELGTNRPIFSDSDGVIRYQFEEISQARRNRYRWHSNRADIALAEYQTWSERYRKYPQRIIRFAGIERRLYAAEETDKANREVAVRNYASVANISRAMRIDYPATSADGDGEHEQPLCRVILCPDGNYRSLKIRHAHEQAAAMAEQGVAVTILKYRTPVDLEGAYDEKVHPLDDLFELLRQLRSESEPGVQIGILGSEAGGHLALMAATHHRNYGASPDFVAAANAPTHAPPAEWMMAMLGSDKGSNPLLRDFYSAGLHLHPGSCPISLSYRQGSDFRPVAAEWSERSHARGITITVDEDTDAREIPKAFLTALVKLKPASIIND